MLFRIWFNRECKDDGQMWVIQPTESSPDNPKRAMFFAPAIEVIGHCEFVSGPPGSCPGGWVEAEGYLIRSGTDNRIIVRNSEPLAEDYKIQQELAFLRAKEAK